MPNSGPVPSVPDDWEIKESMGVPYLLGVEEGIPEWRSVVVHEPVLDEDEMLVTANGRPVFTE